MVEKFEIKQRLEELCLEQEFFRDFNLETGLATQASINMMNYELNISYFPGWTDLVFDKYMKKYLAKKKYLKR